MGKEGRHWALILLSTTQQVLGRYLESMYVKQLRGLESRSLAKTYILNCGSLSLPGRERAVLDRGLAHPWEACP